MILVTDMKVITTHDKKYHPFEHPIYHHGPVPVLGLYDDPEAEICQEVTIEMVKGRRFVNRYGIETVIGWDKQSQELLGLPFEVFEQMEKRRQSDYYENTKLRKKIRELQEQTVWQFLKTKLTQALTGCR